MINYQGYLTDSGGNPINATLQMIFSIYETAVGGSAVWTETQPSVAIADGLFSVLLGSTNPISPQYLTGESYLGIQVGSDPEMTPRQRMVSVAYALRSIIAKNADTLDDLDSTDFVAVTGDTMTGQLVLPANGLVAGTDQLVITGGKVGIGTTSPGTYKLNVQGGSDDGICVSSNDLSVYASSTSGNGVFGTNTASGNYGILGTSTEGVHGYGSTCGVYGLNRDNFNYGQLGKGDAGVYGYASTGYGVLGENNNGNKGQLGTSSYGVYGYGAYGVGGYGTSIGLYGTGTAYGVYGSGTTYGVYGNAATYGVVGSSSSYGVYGYATGSGGQGVRGYGPSSGYDFYAAGPGTNYAPFTGAHEVKLASSFPQDFRTGLIVSVTGETQVRTEDGEISYSSTLPTVRLANTPDDKAVFGVLISETPLPEDHWYQAAEGERFGIVNALGEGRVWVTNINGDIEAGDYITTSAIAGYGQKQDDDLLHSYTLGKATESIDWSQVTETVEFNGQTYKIYPIAVVYTSG
jgi:hypothetical protein